VGRRWFWPQGGQGKGPREVATRRRSRRRTEPRPPHRSQRSLGSRRSSTGGRPCRWGRGARRVQVRLSRELTCMRSRPGRWRDAPEYFGAADAARRTRETAHAGSEKLRRMGRSLRREQTEGTQSALVSAQRAAASTASWPASTCIRSCSRRAGALRRCSAPGDYVVSRSPVYRPR
jgi:hypothetical protein